MSVPDRRQVAILYAELRNFTRLSEALEPAKVVELAAAFFALAARCITATGGRVVCVHNDALLGIFPAGEAKQSAPQAIKAAQDLQREFAPLGERWKNEYGLPATAAIGLHVGEAVSGALALPGAQQPMVLGDCVSIAERLVHRARAGEVVISLDVMKALGPAVKTLGAEELPALELGKRPPLPLYGFIVEDRLDFT